MNMWIKKHHDREISETLAKYKALFEKCQGHATNKEEAIAVLVENQSLFTKCCENQPDFTPLVQKVYEEFLGFDMVSVQPMLGPCSLVKQVSHQYAKREDVDPIDLTMGSYDAVECEVPKMETLETESEIVAKTRKLKTSPNEHSNLEETARAIREEITREIITDLRNNCGTVANFSFKSALGDTVMEKFESLYVKLVEVSDIMFRKTLVSGGDWIVTSPAVVEMFHPCWVQEIDHPKESTVYLAGTCGNRWKLIVDNLFPDNQMLIGAYPGGFDSGYVYTPYVPLSGTPVILSEDFCPRPGYLTRYGKRLYTRGANYYAKIVLDI